VDDDVKLDELHPTAAQLQGALMPYQAAIPLGLDAVMLSTAGFRAYDPTGAPAALPRPIAQGLLRGRLGFRGVTITDGRVSRTAAIASYQRIVALKHRVGGA